MTNIKIWWEAARPRTLPAAAAPVIMGTAMAFHDGLMLLPAAIAALIAALLIQIGTNLANDYFDYIKGADNQERLGPTRATQAGLVAPSTMKWAFVITFLLAFLIGLYLIYLGGWPILLIGLASILFGVLYTGGPYPLGYNGLGDVFVLIFFGPVAVAGTYFVQTLEINHVVLLAGLAPGLISTAILTVNNLRDINTDANAGKRTLVVRFGVGFAKKEYILSILAACLLPLLLIYLTRENFYSVLSLFALVPAIPGMKTVLSNKHGVALNKVLADTGKTLFVYSIVFSVGWII